MKQELHEVIFLLSPPNSMLLIITFACSTPDWLSVLTFPLILWVLLYNCKISLHLYNLTKIYGMICIHCCTGLFHLLLSHMPRIWDCSAMGIVILGHNYKKGILHRKLNHSAICVQLDMLKNDFTVVHGVAYWLYVKIPWAIDYFFLQFSPSYKTVSICGLNIRFTG